MTQTTASGSAQQPSSDGWRLSRVLGPGLITGAADDDPSGIATYSQAGAQLGYAVNWTMLLTFPLMAAVQEISARIGRTTGKGIAANIREHYPSWLLQPIIVLLFLANTINIGADLGAMGSAAGLLIGGPQLLYVAGFGLLCATLQMALPYSRYARVLRWLTLALFAYFGTLAVIKVPWEQVAAGLFVPAFSLQSSFWTMVLAIFGTTISPYLFFWQASQEVEETTAVVERVPLVKRPSRGSDAINRIRLDTIVGMAFSNLVALAIIVTSAATLNANGISNIETASQAAEALRPIAGSFAFAVFTGRRERGCTPRCTPRRAVQNFSLKSYRMRRARGLCLFGRRKLPWPCSRRSKWDSIAR